MPWDSLDWASDWGWHCAGDTPEILWALWEENVKRLAEGADHITLETLEWDVVAKVAELVQLNSIRRQRLWAELNTDREVPDWREQAFISWGTHLLAPTRMPSFRGRKLKRSRTAFRCTCRRLGPWQGNGVRRLPASHRARRCGTRSRPTRSAVSVGAPRPGHSMLVVAQGSADVALGSEGGPWDFALFVVLLDEARGKTSDLTGAPRLTLDHLWQQMDGSTVGLSRPTGGQLRARPTQPQSAM